MNTFTTWMIANWFGLAGIGIGILVAVAVAWWQRKVKRPVYRIRNVVLVEDAKAAFPMLQIHYKGHVENLDTLSAAIIAIWNAGKETLHGTDITSAEPLLVKAKDGVKILGAEIIQSNNKASQIKRSYSKTTNQVAVNFDYLDQGHGCVLEVLHTGTSRESLIVEGTFKGAGAIKIARKVNPSVIQRFLYRGASTNSGFRKRQQSFIIAITIMVVAIFILELVLWDTIHPTHRVVVQEGVRYIEAPPGYVIRNIDGVLVATHDIIPDIMTLALLCIFCIFLAYTSLRRMRSGVPSSLSRYDDYLD